MAYSLEDRIHRLMMDHLALSISSTTVDEIAKTLSVSRTNARAAVLGLLAKGVVKPAEKNPRSAQLRVTLAEARSK